MKPLLDRLVIVSATINPERAVPCFESWAKTSHYQIHQIIVWNGALDTEGMKPYEANFYKTFAPEFDQRTPGGTYLVRPEILGVVPAFALGVAAALRMGAEIICCLHDDVLIEDDLWDIKVLQAFDAYPEMGLMGFGGGVGLGSDDIYKSPYSPHQLARQGFVSNMRDAEAHGRRSDRYERIAVLDGFSQIGRAAFFAGLTPYLAHHPTVQPVEWNIWQQMADWGLVHHAYDAAVGAWAKRLGWQVGFIPVKVHHLGGQTAVGESRYAEWAQTITPRGDADFWEMAHHEVYERFRDVLPIRV